ncbi:MAG: hypothetical protein ABSG46_20445 [Candidatus Binataceae bacterium]|jgi:hypothetical protein
MTELTARMPWVERLQLPVDCQGFMSHTPLKAIYRMANNPPVGLDAYRCKKHAYWKFTSVSNRRGPRILCWAHLWSEMRGTIEDWTRLKKWMRAHRDPVASIDMTAFNREQADIEICILAYGTVKGSREFYMPRGEMATDAFDRELDEAWNRLTPNQQAAILDGRFSMKVGTWTDAMTGKVLP